MTLHLADTGYHAFPGYSPSKERPSPTVSPHRRPAGSHTINPTSTTTSTSVSSTNSSISSASLNPGQTLHASRSASPDASSRCTSPTKTRSTSPTKSSSLLPYLNRSVQRQLEAAVKAAKYRALARAQQEELALINQSAFLTTHGHLLAEETYSLPSPSTLTLAKSTGDDSLMVVPESTAWATGHKAGMMQKVTSAPCLRFRTVKHELRPMVGVTAKQGQKA